MQRFSPSALIAEPVSWCEVGSFVCAAVSYWYQMVYGEVRRVYGFLAQVAEAVVRGEQLGLQLSSSDSTSRSVIGPMTFWVGFPPSPLFSQRFCLPAFIDAMRHSLHLDRVCLLPLTSFLIMFSAVFLIIGAVVFAALGEDGFLVGSIVGLPALSILLSVVLVMLAAIFVGPLTVRLIPCSLANPLAVTTICEFPPLGKGRQGLFNSAIRTAFHNAIITHLASGMRRD